MFQRIYGSFSPLGISVAIAIFIGLVSPTAWGQGCDGCGCPDGEGPTEATINFYYETRCYVSLDPKQAEPTAKFSGQSEPLCWPSSNCSASFDGESEILDPDCIGMTPVLGSGANCISIAVKYVEANDINPGWCDLGDNSPTEDGWFFAIYEIDCSTGLTLDCIASGWGPGDCSGTDSDSGPSIEDDEPVLRISVSGGGCVPLDEGDPCHGGHDEDDNCDGEDSSNSPAGTSSESDEPISLLTGHKTERATDLTVVLPGRDYKLIREYSSDIARYAQDSSGDYFWNQTFGSTIPGRLGAGWDFNGAKSLQAARFNQNGEPLRLYLRGVPLNSTTRFDRLTGGNWFQRGSGNHWIRSGTDTVYTRTGSGTTSTSGSVLRMSKPGGVSVKTFAGFPTTASTASAFELHDVAGQLVSERDKYGNTWYYEWVSLGESSYDNRDLVRLRAIYFNGTPGNELARAEFHWHGDGTANSPYASTLSTDGRYGRLGEVEIIREDDSSQELVTQSVRYTYFDDVANDTIGGDTLTLGSIYSGSSGDLIEVTTAKAMSDPSQLHERVYQYRYYAPNNSNGTSYGDLNLVDFHGEDHQLMAVVYPEQMEFYADYLIQEAERQNGTSGTFLGDDTTGLYTTYFASGFNSAADAARLLRWVRFDTSGTTHPDEEAFLLADQTFTHWQSLYDIAGKLISYYPSGATGNVDGRVRTQIISSGDGSSSCGCGGPTAGMNLGKRYDYIYRRYTLPTDIEPAPSDSDHSNGYSCQIVESTLGFSTSLEFVPYRVKCHDYVWPSTLGDEVIADSDGVARRGAGVRKLATATLPANPSWDFDPFNFTNNDLVGTGNEWASVFEYDMDTDPSGGAFTSYRKVTRKLTPAAIGSSYEPAGATAADDPPDWEHAPTSGLVYVYNYDSGSGWMDWQGVSDGVNGTPVKLAEYDRDSTTRPDLPTEVLREPGQGPTGDTPVERTTVSRGYYGGTGGAPPAGEEADAVVAWERAKQDAETPIQNGPPGTVDYSTWKIWDQQGQLRWERDVDGTLTCYPEYDTRTGVATHIVYDADPGNSAYVSSGIALNSTNFPGLTSANGWSLPTRSTYEELQEYFEVDLLGRVISHTDPGGVKKYWQFEKRIVDTVDDSAGVLVDRGVPYQATLSFPHGFIEDSSYRFDGPIVVAAVNAAGKEVLRESYIAEDSSGSYDPLTETYLLGDVVARSEVELQLSGVTIRSREWHDVTETPAAGSYVTAYEYDPLGRLKATIDPEGGITVNGFMDGSTDESGYDLLDRLIQTSEGLDADHSTIRRTARYFYDSPHTFNQGTPSQGIGNGNLNYMEVYTGEATDGTRSTYRWFDYRNRMLGEAPPELPYSVFAYDDLDRVVEQAAFASASAFGTSVPSPSTTSTDRSTYTQRLYNNRGMVYRTRAAIDPNSGSAPTDFLESASWFDGDGNVIASWSPNAAGTKTAYDWLDRPAVVYQTDRYGDLRPGASSQSSDSYTGASTVTGDHILAQAEYTYVPAGQPGAGEAELVSNRWRLHDAAEPSPGLGALTSSTSVTTYMAYVRDDAGRVTDTLEYGTNSSNGFVSNTSAPTAPYDTNRATSDALIVSTGFDEWGRVNLRTDPAGESTLTVYDSMSRAIATIESQHSITEQQIVWDTNSNDTWDVNWGTPPSETDRDRVTTFSYDGLSQMRSRVAHLNDDSYQVTKYEYGTTAGSTGNRMDSLLASSRLLHKVHYPNESTGEADTSAAYTVEYAYNLAGELRGTTDQNGTEHELVRDGLGRVTADRVHSFGLNIDQTVEQIAAEFDDHGRLQEVRSYDSVDVSPTELNSVAFQYTPLHQISAVIQDFDGQATDEEVLYFYSTAGPNDLSGSSGGSDGNYSRLTGIRYPSQAGGTTDTVSISYTGEVNDRVSRVAGYGAPSWGHTADQSLLQYDHLGVGVPVKVNYTAIGKGLDHTKDIDGPFTSGQYPGYDRFGRIVWHAWVDDNFAFGQTVGPVDYPNTTPLMARRYSYDKVSNREHDWDGRPGATPSDRDWAYTYDRLHRLGTAERGERDSYAAPLGLASPLAPNSEQWQLDMLGNWTKFVTDLDGDELFEAGDETEERTHNAANEIDTREGEPNSGPGGTTPVFTYVYDKAGNLRQNGGGTSNGLKYTHDAWNRLVKVERTASSGDFPILENTFNGLNWRITRKVDLAKGAYDGLDEERRYYYSASWQLLEEHVDTDLTDQDDRDYSSQQIWGTRYIDDAVAKRIDRDDDGVWDDLDSEFYYLTDAMFSVRALTNDAGQVRERIDYTPYGVAKHRYAADLNADGMVDSTDGGILATNLNSGFGLSPGDAGYDPDVDVDGDGIDTTDQGAYSSVAKNQGSNIVPEGWLTDPTDSGWTDNSVGCDAYLFDNAGASDASSAGVYSVRFRVYDPSMGRWMVSDPLQYRGGASLYLYANARPTVLGDWSGLAPARNVYTISGSDCTPWRGSRQFRLGEMEWSSRTITVREWMFIDPVKGDTGSIYTVSDDEGWKKASDPGSYWIRGGGTCRYPVVIRTKCVRECDMCLEIDSYDVDGNLASSGSMELGRKSQSCEVEQRGYIYGTTHYAPSVGGAPVGCRVPKFVWDQLNQETARDVCDGGCADSQSATYEWRDTSGGGGWRRVAPGVGIDDVVLDPDPFGVF